MKKLLLITLILSFGFLIADTSFSDFQERIKTTSLVSGQILYFDGTDWVNTSSFPVTNLTVADEGWVGLGAAKGRIVFNDETTDDLTITDADLIIGNSIDDLQPTFSIIGDADSDAGDDVSETLALTLTPNIDPTLSKWGFTGTQGAGYSFDKNVFFSDGLVGTPSMSFTSDTDMGFYVIAASSMGWSAGGILRWRFGTTYFGSQTATRPRLKNTDASFTNPTITPNGGDDNTGIGGNNADALSLIAGGVEGIRITEATTIDVNMFGDIIQQLDLTRGGFKQVEYYATVNITAITTITLDLNIPTNSKILGCYLHVATAFNVNEPFDAEYNDGSQVAAIGTALAIAQNTNTPVFYDENAASAITDATTDILLTKNGGGDFTSTSGTVEVVVYVQQFVPWTND